jgi:hypothetical protein
MPNDIQQAVISLKEGLKHLAAQYLCSYGRQTVAVPDSGECSYPERLDYGSSGGSTIGNSPDNAFRNSTRSF